MAGTPITTLEGLGTPERPHPIQQAFIEEQAAQCGFCLSGVILTAKAFLDQNPRATDPQIQQALAGVLCRCFVHARMFRASRRYADGITPRRQARSGAPLVISRPDSPAEARDDA
jgi:nicotinate dehydrogenase subunit A